MCDQLGSLYTWDWEDGPLSFEETPPPLPAQPHKSAPSRSSTGFSALTMRSSEDSSLDISEFDRGPSEEPLEMDDDDGQLDDGSNGDAFPPWTDHEAWQSDEELPGLAFSSGEEATSLEPSPTTPHRGRSSSWDDGFDLVDMVENGRQGVGRSQSSSTETGTPPYDKQEEILARPECTTTWDEGEEMLGDEEDFPPPKKPWARPPSRKRRKVVHSCTSQVEQGGAPVTSNATERQHDPTLRAAAITRPHSPTLAEMDAFFGFVAPELQIDPQLLNLRANSGQIRANAALAQKARDRAATGSFEHQPGDLGLTIGWSQRTESGLKAPTSKQKRTSERSYYQLEPIPSLSTSSGEPLSAAEKRCVQPTKGPSGDNVDC